MVKAVIFLKRREDLSKEAFNSWWLGPHKELAQQLPGLKRFTFNIIHDDAHFDGIAEQWFETMEDLQAAYGTDIGKAVAEDSLKHVSDRQRVIVEEHEFVLTAG